MSRGILQLSYYLSCSTESLLTPINKPSYGTGFTLSKLDIFFCSNTKRFSRHYFWKAILYSRNTQCMCPQLQAVASGTRMRLSGQAWKYATSVTLERLNDTVGYHHPFSLFLGQKLMTIWISQARFSLQYNIKYPLTVRVSDGSLSQLRCVLLQLIPWKGSDCACCSPRVVSAACIDQVSTPDTAMTVLPSPIDIDRFEVRMLRTAQSLCSQFSQCISDAWPCRSWKLCSKLDVRPLVVAHLILTACCRYGSAVPGRDLELWHISRWKNQYVFWSYLDSFIHKLRRGMTVEAYRWRSSKK